MGRVEVESGTAKEIAMKHALGANKQT